VAVVDIDEGCGLVRVVENRRPIPALFETLDLNYSLHFDGHQTDMLQLKTIRVRDDTSG
jgi:hypothetical protein